MNKRLLLPLLVLLACGMAHAQGGNTLTIRFAGAPSGSCAPFMLGINNATGAMYDCLSGSWNLVGGGGGGSGTVTSVLGTTNQINSDGSTTTPTLSLSSTLALPGTLSSATNGALSQAAVTLTGTPITSGTATTNFPLFYINSGTAPTNFNTAGEILGVNAPSGFTGNLFDLYANGTREFRVQANGNVFVAGVLNAGTSNYGNTVSTLNGISTIGNGVPAIYAAVDLTAQTAAKAATTINTPTNTGMFRITVYEKVTTAASVSSVLGGTTGTTITYTDGTDSVAQSVVVAMQTETGANAKVNAGNATTTVLSGSIYIFAKSANAIQYAIDYTSSGTAMAYEAHLKLESL